MKSIHKSLTMLATFAAILSLSIGFVPQVMAGGGFALQLTLIADCGFSVSPVDLVESADPGAVTSATFAVEMANTGTGSLPVDANLGDGTVDTSVSSDPNVGGFADATRQFTTDISVLPTDVTMNADLGGSGGAVSIGNIGNVVMTADGVDIKIADLGPTSAEGENGLRQVSIVASLTNLQNLPAVGLQTADATFTGGLCA